MTPILPPFPFPNKWSTLLQSQTNKNFQKWSVPPECITKIERTDDTITSSYNRQQIISNSQERTVSNTSTLELENEHLDYEEYGEQFILNDMWADRFSKTLKRINKKAHKIKRSSIGKNNKR